MKVVYLTRDLPRSRSQIQMLHERHPISAVVVEAFPPMKKRIQKRLRLRSRADFLIGATYRAARAGAARVGLGSRHEELGLLPPPTIPDGVAIHHVDTINSPEARSVLDQLAADVVLVRGTSLIKDAILADVPLALNAHAGLSPYYRGSHCTQWALLNWDPYNIGVTVHQVTKAIDGGDIFGQARVTVTPSDTVDSIEDKIAYEGGRIFLAALDHLATGQPLPMQGQERLAGTLRLGLHWDAYCEAHVNSLVNPDIMSAMLKRPIRRQLPIVETPAGPS